MSRQSTTSDLDHDPQPKSRSKSKSKAKRNPPILSPATISSSSRKLFSPFLRPARIVRQPSPPSLAWSKLPPPAAEVDERPTSRTRRFRLWKNVVPALRIAVLDPRKRFHLRRYQSFAVPGSIPPVVARRQILSIPGNEWSMPLTMNKLHAGNTSRSVTQISLRPTNPCDEQTSSGPGDGIVRKPRSFTPLPSPPPTPNPLSEREPNHRTSIRPPDDVPRLRELSNHIKQSSQTPTPPSTSKPPSPAEKRARKADKKAAHQRLLGHKWVLDQEHERRFRRGMDILMNQVMEFQRDNTLPFDQWSRGKKWKEGVDNNHVADILYLFKDIRKKSDRIYDYFDPNDLAPVPGRAEAHAKVREEEKRSKRKKERKEKKKLAEAEAHAAIANSAHLRESSQSGDSGSTRTLASTSKLRPKPPLILQTETTAQAANPDTAARSRTDRPGSDSSSASSRAPVTPQASIRTSNGRILLSSCSDRRPSGPFTDSDDVDQLLRGGSRSGRKRDRATRRTNQIADRPDTRVAHFAIRIEDDDDQDTTSGLEGLMRRLGFDKPAMSSDSPGFRLRRPRSNSSTGIGPESSVSTSSSTGKHVNGDQNESEFDDPPSSLGVRFGSLNLDDDTCDPFPSSQEAESVDLDVN